VLLRLIIRVDPRPILLAVVVTSNEHKFSFHQTFLLLSLLRSMLLQRPFSANTFSLS
jgi:hypothetical protein